MDEYVVLKLCSGELLIAILINETDHGIVILDAISIKYIPGIFHGQLGEQTAVSNFCAWTIDREFTFNHKDILFCKPLRLELIEYYKKSISSLNDDKKEVDHEEYENALELLSKTSSLH